MAKDKAMAKAKDKAEVEAKEVEAKDKAEVEAEEDKAEVEDKAGPNKALGGGVMTRGKRTEKKRTEELAKLIIDIEKLQKRKAEIEKEALHNQPAKRGKKGG